MFLINCVKEHYKNLHDYEDRDPYACPERPEEFLAGIFIALMLDSAIFLVLECVCYAAIHDEVPEDPTWYTWLMLGIFIFSFIASGFLIIKNETKHRR